MPDSEKVIKGLEQFKSDFKPFCGNNADWKRFDDALAMLKEQKEQEAVVRCKYCTYKDEINCPQYYRRNELTDSYFCADGKLKND